LAALLRGLGRFETALEVAQAALRLQSTPEGWLELARIEEARGEAETGARVREFLRGSLKREGQLTPEWTLRLAGNQGGGK
ncbi:MAG TPA: hypothetical protein DDW80_04260, partial [Desulfovibrio sp.]|nr:hypothetical protein [Desulfovibrio sp.]